MKTPRVQDFDPDAPIPSLSSPLDNLPSIRKPERPKTRTGEEVHAPRPQRANTPTSLVQQERRVIKRGSFEFFTDQLELLKWFSLEDKLQGKGGSQSEMVREALDAYLVKRKAVNTEDPNARTGEEVKG